MAWEKRWFQYAILLLLAFIWGSSFILIKTGLKSFSSLQAAAIRIFLASLVLLPLSIRHLRKMEKKDVKYILIAGFVGNLIPAFLFPLAQTRIDSALAGMLNSLTPLFTLIIGLILFRTRTRVIQVVGLLLGLAGALGLIVAGEEISFSNINGYSLYVVLATICYAVSVNVVKSYLTHLRGIQITTLTFFFIGPVALGFLLSSDLGAATANPNWYWHFAALALLGVLGSAVAMLLMNSLIRYSSAVYSSSVTYIIPVFAILWGVFDHEIITPLHLGSMTVVLLGVYMVNRKV